jgi:acetyl esterase/lipase
MAALGLAFTVQAEKKDEEPGGADRKAELLKRFDADGDGEVSDSEKAGVKKAMVKRFDKNGDGNIAKEEVPGKLWARLSKLDTNGDNVVSKQELAGEAGEAGEGPGTGPEVRQESTYNVTVTELVYGQGQAHSSWGGPVTGTIDLKLDIYEPVNAPPGRPAMVIVHGGGFKGGSKTADAYENFAHYFAERGWVAMSIDYRVIRDYGTVPAEWADYVASNIPPGKKQDQYNAMYTAARDAKAAVRWLSANADTYKVDLDYVTSTGGSAGAFTAIMLGVTDQEDFRDELTVTQDPTLASTNLDQPAEIHTIIEHWGGSAQVDTLEALDGVSRFDATDAPISIVHGTKDPAVPIAAGEKLRDEYIETGVPYAFYPLQGEGHGPWEATVDGKSLEELAFDFIVEQQDLTVGP